MVAAANLVEVAALVGDTARATMLNALMGGQSLTATELAYCAVVKSDNRPVGTPSLLISIWKISDNPALPDVRCKCPLLRVKRT